MTFIFRIIYSPYINYIIRNINKLLFKIIPIIKLPPSGTLKIKLSNNQLLKFNTNQTDFVAFSIFWDGLYNYEYVYIFEKIAKKLNGFIDIGSNGGLYSLIAAKNSEKIKVLSFDPTESANYYINKNIKLNHLNNKISSFKLALSDKTEVLDFFEVKNPKYPFLKYNLGGSSSLVNHPKAFQTIAVQAYSFDHFLVENPIHNFIIDFIKIDAEGAEPSIIIGMKKTIEKYKPIIVCEILSAEVGNEIENLFLGLGYQFFLNKERFLIPISSFKGNISDNLIYNCFFVHPSKLHLIDEFVKKN